MIRKSTLTLTYANTNKTRKLVTFLDEYVICVNKFIDLLWEIKRFKGSFVEKSLVNKVDTSLYSAAKQSCASTALHIVKSQIKKKNKIKPLFNGGSFELDQRFIQIIEGKNSFDLWIKFRGFGDRKSILIPTKKHKHYLKFLNDGWKLKKSGRVRIIDNKLSIDVFFEKNAIPFKTKGEIIGLDCGYKKLGVCSTSQIIGQDLEKKILKISQKVQGSKAFKRALIERNEYINREIKKLPFNTLKGLVVEDLKNVKHKTKGKIRKQFMNKLQRWVYAYFLTRLSQTCEVVGVQCHKIDPAYTSQMCSKCGGIHKENRKGELFLCIDCGYTTDADFNASKNILNRFLLQEFTDPVKKNCVLGLPSA